MRLQTFWKNAACSKQRSREQYVTLWYRQYHKAFRPKLMTSHPTADTYSHTYRQECRFTWLLTISHHSGTASVSTGRLITLSDNYRSPLAVGLFERTDVAHTSDRQHARRSSGMKWLTDGSYRTALLADQEERSSRLLRGGRLKSRTGGSCLKIMTLYIKRCPVKWVPGLSRG